MTRYKVIDVLRHQYNVKELCHFLNVSRSGYYKYLKRKDHDPDAVLKELIQTVFIQFNRIYGYRQIQMELERQYQVKVNHKKVLRLMQQLNLRAIIRRKRQFPSSYKDAVVSGRVVENLLQRNFTAEAPNQKWLKS